MRGAGAPRALPRRARLRAPALLARRSLALLLRRRRGAGHSSRSSSRTSASKACSAPRPAPSSATCRSRSASASTTRRPPQAVKALYATGFFRDVRLEAQGGVLVVSVQERPTISRSRSSATRNSTPRRCKKALKEIGIAEARIFDRSALDRAEQEMKRQYITRGKYAAKVHDHGDAAGAQPRRDQLHDRGRRVRQDRADQHRRQQGVHRARAARADVADHARLADLVHEERPVLEAEAAGRPRDAAQLLPEPRLPRVQHRIDAGVDHAGQGGHLHHRSTSPKARSTRCPTSAWPASSMVPEAELRALVQMRPGDVYLARAAAGVGQGDQRPARRRRLRVRERQRGARDRPREATRSAFTFFVDPGRRVYVRKINISGNAEDARRGDPPRDAAARGRVVRRHPHRALEGPHAAPRLLRGASTSRRRRCRAPPTRSTSR